MEITKKEEKEEEEEEEERKQFKNLNFKYHNGMCGWSDSIWGTRSYLQVGFGKSL
jgi:hypothetical protein